MFKVSFWLKYPLNQRLALLVIILGGANVFVWGEKGLAKFPEGILYSTGTAFSLNGAALKMSDKLTFSEEHFSYSVKVDWDNKTNLMQEVGIAKRGVRGEYDVVLDSSSSFGPSVLAEGLLDDYLSFRRSYLQTHRAKIRLLPLSGEYQGLCYLFLHMQKLSCGSSRME